MSEHMENPLVSIAIPTYNEEEDIKKTLDAAVNITYSNKEIIVVDDSTDRTPEIVHEYASRGVRLIHRENNVGGRCGARNAGIEAARGEIVVILNADVLLPPDFIDRILIHYRNGAGYVLVDSRVINQEYLFPRFFQAMHEYTYANSQSRHWKTAYWSEGYSCLREAAIKAGLFPKTPVVVKAGEDGYFGKKIHDLGYKKAVDRSIIVSHYAPYRFRHVWRIQEERVSSGVSYFLDKRSFAEILTRALARTVLSFLKVLLIIPSLIMGYLVARHSPKRSRDTLPFAYAYAVRELAFISGKWKSLWVLFVYLIHQKDSSVRT